MFSRHQNTVERIDPELSQAIQTESRHQEDHNALIASENYTSPAVMAAQGSQLTNKYAEEYPNKRYYGGCEHVNVVEQLGIDRVKRLYGAGFAAVLGRVHSTCNKNVATLVQHFPVYGA